MLIDFIISPLYRPVPPSAAPPLTSRYRLHRLPLLPPVIAFIGSPSYLGAPVIAFIGSPSYRLASFFSGVRIRLGTILGRFSIIYFRGLGLRIRAKIRANSRKFVFSFVFSVSLKHRTRYACNSFSHRKSVQFCNLDVQTYCFYSR